MKKMKRKAERTDNRIGDEGMKMISEALKSISTLSSLYLRGDDNRPQWHFLKEH